MSFTYPVSRLRCSHTTGGAFKQVTQAHPTRSCAVDGEIVESGGERMRPAATPRGKILSNPTPTGTESSSHPAGLHAFPNGLHRSVRLIPPDFSLYS